MAYANFIRYDLLTSRTSRLNYRGRYLLMQNEPVVKLTNLRCMKQPLLGGVKWTPVTKLAKKDHVHGDLEIRPNGTDPIHNFGYWNERDACIGQWYFFLLDLKGYVDGCELFEESFPYPDQSDPKLEFIGRRDEITIRTSCFDDDWFGDTNAQPDDVDEQTITRKSCRQMVDMAIELIESSILTASPKIGQKWLDRNGRR